MNKKILFVVNDLSFFISHRLDLALSVREKGFSTLIAYGDGSQSSRKTITDLGLELYQYPLKRGTISPVFDVITFITFLKLFAKIKPDIVHLITIKPYFYGGIAARILKINGIVSAITGLGSFFLKKGLWAYILKKIFENILIQIFKSTNQIIIVQNHDDFNYVNNTLRVQNKNIWLIKGTGVNSKQFKKLKEPNKEIVVSYIGRLLRDKGVLDFVDAAYLIARKTDRVKFQLVGSVDKENISSISDKTIKKWKDDGVICVRGYCKDILKILSETNIVCLPSYREGLPRALLEAAASGRAIVTTDVPGCRDAIIPNKTGLLVPVNSSKQLANAILKLIDNPELRKKMGREARKFAKLEFSDKKIHAQHIEIYRSLVC